MGNFIKNFGSKIGWMKVVLVFFLIILYGNEVKGQTHYYLKSGTNAASIRNTSSWTINSDGTGANPANFTSNNCYYHIEHAGTFSNSGTWTVSGTGSKVILGNGTNATIFNTTSGTTSWPSVEVTSNANLLVTTSGLTLTSLSVSGIVEWQVSGGTLYSSTWNSGSQLILNSNSVPSGLNQTFHHVKLLTGSNYVGLPSEFKTVNGNLEIVGSGTYGIRGLASGDNTITVGGNFSITTGSGHRLQNTGGGILTLNIGGSFTIGSSTTVDSYTGDVNINFTGTGTFTNSGTFTTDEIDWTINSGAILTLASNLETVKTCVVTGTLICGTNTAPMYVTGAGTFTLSNASTAELRITDAAGITLATGTATGNIKTTGGRTFNTGAKYYYNDNAAQTTGTGLPASCHTLTIDNSSGVTLTAACEVTNSLVFTSGILTTTTSNLLYVSNTSTSAITGHGSTKYVSGPLKWALANSSGTYEFPVGKGGNYYPFTFSSHTSTTPILQVESFNSNAGGNGLTLSTTEYWKVDYTNTVTAGTVKIQRPTTISGLNAVATSTASNGTYTTLGNSAATTTSVTASTSVGTVSGSTRYYTFALACPTYGTVGITTTYTVGSSSDDFASLTDAISKLNTCGYNGNLILELQSDYVGNSTNETFPITFPSTYNSVASSSSRKITIRPASGVSSALSITGSSTTYLIGFDGASYVTIDGRNGGSGTNKYLTIENTSIATGGSAIKFVNDASVDTLKYCTIKSNYTNTTWGVIWFSTTSGANGNDNNVITNCIVDGTAGNSPSATSGVAQHGIYSLGTTGKTNSGNKISYCEFKDFFVDNDTTSAILISNYNDSWTFNNNSFYETDTRTATGTRVISSIYIRNGDGYTINNNYFGGSSASCGTGGTVTSWTQTSTGSNGAEYYGIYISSANTTIGTSIQGNVFQKFTWTLYANAARYWKAISTPSTNASYGILNIGNVSPNIIGDTTGTASSIVFNFTGAGATSVFYGIDVKSSSSVTISNNNIGSILVSNVAYGMSVYGISTAGSGSFKINSNKIGSSSTANNILLGGTNTATNVCKFYGINNAASGVDTISSNIIKNVTIYGTGASSIYGVYNTGGTTNSSISSNIIANLTNTSAGTDGVNKMIFNSAAAAMSISSNAISNITINNGTFIGIDENVAATGTHTISSNTIGSDSDTISITSTSGNPSRGISIGGTGTYSISSNTIQKMYQSGAAQKHLYGINLGSTGTFTVSGNTIDKLYNLSTGSYQSYVAGIYSDVVPNSQSVIEKNKITNFKNLNSNRSYMFGLCYMSASDITLNAYNNFFECDNENTNLANCAIYGFYGDAIKTLNFYHNTIYIYGSTPTNTVNEGVSSCLRHFSTGTFNVKNNILINSRTDNGTNSTQNISYSNYHSAYDDNYYYTRDVLLSSGAAGSNSIYSQYHSSTNPTPPTIYSDGSLESAGYTTVGSGVNLSPTITDDIRSSARVDYTRGCYEGVAMTYFSKFAVANTDANTLSNWNTKRDGSGSTPSNFTSESKFRIQSGHKYQVTSSWTGHASSIIYVESGGALDVNAQTISTWSGLNLAGSGVSSTSGALISTGSSTVSLPVVLSANTTISSTSTGNLTLSGTLTNGGYALTVNGTNNTTISGVISGSGAVSKSGSGILTLSGTNTFTGGVSVSAGTLAIGNNSGLGTGTLTISSGSLDASGADRTITNAMTVSGSFTYAGTSYNLTQNTGAVGLSTDPVITVTNNNLTINGVVANSGTTPTTITSTGNSSWTCPSSVFNATVYCWGGGGGSKAVNNGGGGVAGAAGGSIAYSTVTTTPGSVYKYTIGTGGAGGTIVTTGGISTYNNGSNGGSTFFGNSVAGNSSDASILANGGAGGSLTPGLGSTTGNIGSTSYAGGDGAVRSGSVYSGAGGGGAGSGSAGGTGVAGSPYTGGSGGTGTYQGGAGGAGRGGGGAGYPGNAPGGGAGGVFASGDLAGASGGNGQIVIEYLTPRAITKSGSGILTLGGSNTFSKGVTLSAGTLNINNSAALGLGTFTVSGGTIDNTSGSTISYTNAMSIGSSFTFTGSSNLTQTTGAVTLTATPTITTTANSLRIGGVISGAYNLTKSGAGTLILAGVNTYTGSTTVSAGMLEMGVNNAIPVGGAGVVMNGGTLNTGNFTAGSTSTNIGTLTLTDNSTLALGTGTLYFSGSTSTSWTSAKTLTITGFVSSATSTAGTAGRLFVDYRSGNDCSNCGLTGSSGTNQLGLISFNTATINGVAGTYGATQMVTGEIVVVSVTATITLAANTVSAANICASSTKVPIQSFSLAITDAAGNLTNVGFTTTGSYVQGDVAKYQLWYHTSNDITGATQLGTDLSSSGAAGSRSFSAFTSPVLSNNATYYFWITVDVASSATNNATIAVNAISTSNLTSTSTKAGSDTDAGGTQTLKSLPSISTHPSAATICYGGTYSPTVAASGGVTLSYQWEFSTDGTTGWGNVVDGTPSNSTFADATTATLTQTGNIAAGSAYYYRCVVSSTGNGCSSVNSNTAQLTIVADPTWSTNTVTPATICEGGQVTFSATVSGGSGNTITWTRATSSGAAGSTVTSPNTEASATTAYYRPVYTSSVSGCSLADGTEATISIVADPTIGTQPSAVTECIGGSDAVSVSASGGTPSLSYQWYSNTSNSNSGGTLIGSATSSSYTIPSTTSGTTYYYVVVSASGNGCTAATSSAVAGTINAIPSITSHPSDVTITEGGTYSPSITATGGVSLTYQWQFATTSGGVYSSVANNTPTNASYASAATNNMTMTGSVSAGTYYYKCYVTSIGSGCSAVLSNVSILTINTSVTTFYYVGTGNMSTISNWGSNTNGTGTNPSSITGNNLTFYITHNNTTAPSSTEVTWTLGTGSKIIVGDGSNSTNFTINAGNEIAGTIDVSNNATLTISSTTNPTLGTLNSGSTIVYAGSSAQTLPTGASIPRLTINNTNGVTVSGNSTISNTLTLSLGKLIVPSNTTLSLGTASSDISLSTGDATSYIACTDTTSKILRYVNNNATLYTFPMGDASSYTPMTLNFISGANGGSKYITTSVKNTVAPGFVSANFSNYIKRYWLLYGSGFTNGNYKYNITYKYVDSDVEKPAEENTLIPVKRSGSTWYKPRQATRITNGTVQGSGSVTIASNVCAWDSLTTFSFDMAAGDEAAALPIHLLYFTAKPEAKKVRLDWATASETNNDYFTVERSQDGEHFNELFKKPGAGISTTNLYYFGYDNKPLDGISYYRLKQTDYDGKFAYSDIESVSLQGTSHFEGLKVYPNPSDDNRVHVEFSGEQKKEVTCILHDAVGKEIAVNVFEADKGLNSFTLEYPEVATGMYLLEIRSSDGNVQQIQLKLGK